MGDADAERVGIFGAMSRMEFVVSSVYGVVSEALLQLRVGRVDFSAMDGDAVEEASPGSSSNAGSAQGLDEFVNAVKRWLGVLKELKHVLPTRAIPEEKAEQFLALRDAMNRFAGQHAEWEDAPDLGVDALAERLPPLKKDLEELANAMQECLGIDKGWVRWPGLSKDLKIFDGDRIQCVEVKQSQGNFLAVPGNAGPQGPRKSEVMKRADHVVAFIPSEESYIHITADSVLEDGKYRLPEHLEDGAGSSGEKFNAKVVSALCQTVKDIKRKLGKLRVHLRAFINSSLDSVEELLNKGPGMFVAEAWENMKVYDQMKVVERCQELLALLGEFSFAFHECVRGSFQGHLASLLDESTDMDIVANTVRTVGVSLNQIADLVDLEHVHEHWNAIKTAKSEADVTEIINKYTSLINLLKTLGREQLPVVESVFKSCSQLVSELRKLHMDISMQELSVLESRASMNSESLMEDLKCRIHQQFSNVKGDLQGVISARTSTFAESLERLSGGLNQLKRTTAAKAGERF